MTPIPHSKIRRLFAALLVLVFAAGVTMAITRPTVALLEDEILWCSPRSDEDSRHDLGGPPPTFTFPNTNLDVIVELALGADLTADPNTWTWTDISTFVRLADRIVISRGRGDEWTQAGPSQAVLTLDNRDGRFTRLNPVGAFYGQLRRNTPLRIRVDLHTGAGPQTRFTGYVTQWPPRWDKSGNNRWTPITADGIFRRLGQGDPLRSAMFRSISGVAANDYVPHAYWPMEDGSGATQVASGLSGGSPLVLPTDITLAANSALTGSDPLPSFAAGSALVAAIPAYTATGKWVVQFSLRVPTQPGSDIDLLEATVDGSAAAQYKLILQPGSSLIRFEARDSAGALISSGADVFTPATFYGNWFTFALAVRPYAVTPTDVHYTVHFFDGLGTSVGPIGNILFTSTTPGVVTGVSLLADVAVNYGHLAVFTDANFDTTADVAATAPAMYGHPGEQAHERIARLCREEGIPFEITGTTPAKMGAQPNDTLLNVLRDAESTDLGVLYETLDGRIGYRTNTDRYNRDPALTLDYDAGQVMDPWTPQDDDQKLKNDITVTRPGGSSARAEDATSIANEGRYKLPHGANTETDGQLGGIASWLRHIGTFDELRYPSVGVKLHRHTGLIPAWLAFDVLTHRLDISNLPTPVLATTEQAIEGYTETIGSRDWEIALNLAPYGPHQVGQAGGGSVTGSWAQTSGTELAADITSSATSFNVNITAGPLWTTTPAGQHIIIGGEVMALTGVSGASSPQTFVVTRSVNGVVKAHIATGTAAARAVKVHRPLIAAP